MYTFDRIDDVRTHELAQNISGKPLFPHRSFKKISSSQLDDPHLQIDSKTCTNIIDFSHLQPEANQMCQSRLMGGQKTGTEATTTRNM